jgi:probable rRNA maturation factor
MDESRLFSGQRGRLPRRKTIALADMILKGEKQKLPIDIVFSDDSRLRKLNYRFRGKRPPTDVLAFPTDPDLGILGEIYISIDAARRQAKEYKVTINEEILRLVCHGTLHLCGYNHHRPTDAARMRKLEDRYLSGLAKNA